MNIASFIYLIGWDIILLFGAGFVISKSFQTTGLANAVAKHLEVLATVPTPLMILIVCLTTTFLGEVMSNTAQTSLMLPILASTAQVMRINPLLLMIPSTIAASCGFMLPSATPPNTIAMKGGLVKPKDMRWVGLAMDFIGVIIVSVVSYITIVILKVF